MWHLRLTPFTLYTCQAHACVPHYWLLFIQLFVLGLPTSCWILSEYYSSGEIMDWESHLPISVKFVWKLSLTLVNTRWRSSALFLDACSARGAPQVASSPLLCKELRAVCISPVAWAIQKKMGTFLEWALPVNCFLVRIGFRHWLLNYMLTRKT